jgi:mannosylglycoprotein endo-beta-mannosidase
MNMRNKCTLVLFILYLASYPMLAQEDYELNSGWKCINSKEVSASGEKISSQTFNITGWMPAIVPGTVLTTMLNNKLIPDPFYGMNNKQIPDINNTGNDYYTYWFVKDFKEKLANENEQIWLNFRGVNYGCDIFFNGNRITQKTHFGMFLRQSFNITRIISKDGNNRLAVIVYPPDPSGNANGGQGGDGTIAKNVTHQYAAGWDWIQPVRDRNTGIWDKVSIEKTLSVNIKNPHIITQVPGIRYPDEQQEPVTIIVSAEIENPTNRTIKGILQYDLEGVIIKKEVTLQAGTSSEVRLPDNVLKNPRLWWPNGYGKQDLYDISVQFLSNGTLFDSENIRFGIREIQTSWNKETKSRQISVNGQKIFMKGGNWIISDAMLRFSQERYDAEVRFHRDMNLNLIRIWGGAITERPEFYNACDKYGILVFQDLWITADCNGRWRDRMKKEDQKTRRLYPDDHGLFIQSAIDQVKMIRNHPSLAFWCGGNETTPPDDILTILKDSIFPVYDGTRFFFDYSNSDDMSYKSADGPYDIQNISFFWNKKSFPFNSEMGSVGTGDYESLKRFIPEKNMVAPVYPGAKSSTTGGRVTEDADSVWEYHKYIGYKKYVSMYGTPENVEDFANKAQLVNYDQYRALMEGYTSHVWEWYTGVIIWKTQNPWTALRGQMYDWYLDPNACLYGLRNGSEPIHVMCDPDSGIVMAANNSFRSIKDLTMEVSALDMKGQKILLSRTKVDLAPSSVQKYSSLKDTLDFLRKKEGMFLSLRLIKTNNEILSENFYWLPDLEGTYRGLQKIAPANIKVKAMQSGKGTLEVEISNPAGNTVAFFNRISLVNKKTKQRILPVFYSNNYVSVLPGEKKAIMISFDQEKVNSGTEVSVAGWNVGERFIKIQK